MGNNGSNKCCGYGSSRAEDGGWFLMGFRLKMNAVMSVHFHISGIRKEVFQRFWSGLDF